jgi:hypothetical protein
MNAPMEDRSELLHEQLDQLASSVSGGETIDGVQLYRQGVRRRRGRIAVAAGVATAVVAAGVAAFGTVVHPEAFPGVGPASDPSGSGCEIPERWAPAVESGALSEEEACQAVLEGEGEIAARQGGPVDYRFPEGPSLVIQGTVNETWVTECRNGTFHSDYGAEAEDLLCNAILKIAAGELRPTELCGPPDCSEPATPVWAYGQAQLREPAGADR